MSSQKSSKIILIEFKFLTEEKEDVEELCKKGLADLGYCLNELKGRLSKKVDGQVEKFEEQFFNKPPDIEEAAEKAKAEALKKDSEEETLPVAKKEKWAKKLYREIVLLTHPDKTAAIPIPQIVTKLLKFYNIAVDAYASDDFSELLYVANELDLEVPDNKVQEHIGPKVKILSEEIGKKKATFPYQWETMPEDKRGTILENYLRSIGYIFDKEVIEEVVEKVKRIKRKPGTRPVNYIRQRIKSQ